MPQVTLSIDEKLYQEAKKAAKEGDFASVEEYILFILKDVLLDEEVSPSSAKNEHEESVKERLRSLGYIE